MSTLLAFTNCFSEENLQKIYNERIKNSGAVGLDKVRPSKLEEKLNEELHIIIRKALKANYNFTAYKEKLISKGAHSCPRQISIPTARDRIVLRALCEFLSEAFPNAKLHLPQEIIDSLKQALKSQSYAEYAKIDLKNFYPSIPHSLVSESIEYLNIEAKNLIKNAITTPTVPESMGRKNTPPTSQGVPQGLAISNILAEIALQKIDSLYQDKSNIWYQRYVDDILILTPKGQSEIIAKKIIKQLTDLGLTPHAIEPGSKSKHSDLSDPFSFLGYQIENGEITIRRESILRFESSIAKILTAYKYKEAHCSNENEKQRAKNYCQWKLDLKITGCIFEGRRFGWAAYFSQITSTAQLRSINDTIEKLIIRFHLKDIIRPKSLIKTFYELQKSTKKYSRHIPNFDNLSTSQKRHVLKLWIGDNVKKLTDYAVERQFSIKVAKVTRDLEKDIAQIS